MSIPLGSPMLIWVHNGSVCRPLSLSARFKEEKNIFLCTWAVERTFSVHSFYSLFVCENLSTFHPTVLTWWLTKEEANEEEKKSGPRAKDEMKRANYFDPSFWFTFSFVSPEECWFFSHQTSVAPMMGRNVWVHRKRLLTRFSLKNLSNGHRSTPKFNHIIAKYKGVEIQ